MCLAAILTACGDEGDADARDDSTPSAASPASETPAPPPAPVENETCIQKMTPLVDVMLANETNNLGFLQFEDRVNLLTRKIDDALAPCSNKVNSPARRVMYLFTLARLQWDLCDEDSCMGEVTKNLTKGVEAAYRAQAALEAVA